MWIVWLEKKIMKTLGILLGILIILITALHIYVVNNAETLIEDLVKTRSNNKLRLKVQNIKFNYFSKKIELQQVAFYSNDSLDLKTSYSFHVDNIKLRVKALLPIFTRKELLVDSLYLSAPKIEVTRLKPSDTPSKKDVSIPQEMGKIYNSIIDALTMFEVTRFELNDGVFTLQNKIHPNQVPLTISHLHIHIDNFKIDSTGDPDKFFFSDQMVFRTRNQDMLFPDGRHRLAFSRFRINIRKKIIEIDSCTLSGKRSVNGRSGFNIFLDTLKLINVDFKALYEKELIKADSVFCRNPDFKIQLAVREKQAGKKKLLNMDTLIQQLTGDLLLKYVGVINAGLDITTYQGENPSSFTSKHNNFEMTGLSIDQTKAQPVSLESFDMAIRNYENFLKDSSYFFRFDSILLRENRILLSNFSVNTERFKDTRNIKVRQFALSGLSWGELLFNRKIIARQATLFNPDINYVQPDIAKSKNNKAIISSLESINNIMDLEKLQIINGQIKIKTRTQTELLLDNANLLMTIHEVTTSPTVSNAERSVEYLGFRKGVLKLNDLTVKMDNTFFDGEMNRLTLGKMNVYNRDQAFNILTKNTVLENLQFNDSLNFISSEGINWAQARLEINSLQKERRKHSSPLAVALNNIRGNNTEVDFNSEKSSVSVFLNSLSANKITKQDKLLAEEVKTTGKNLSYFTPKTALQVSVFSINDHASSTLNSFHLKQTEGSNSFDVNIPEVVFTPDLNSIISNTTAVKNVQLNYPEISIKINEKGVQKENKPISDFTIDSIAIENPVFKIENSLSKGLALVNWNGSGNRLLAKNIQSVKSNKQISISSLDADFSNFLIVDSVGKRTGSKNVTANARFEDILLQPGDKLNWSAMMKELTARNFVADSLGKRPAIVKVQSGKIENLLIGSEFVSSLPVLIKKNPSFTVSNISGYIIDEKNNWQWHNLTFSKAAQSITLDSFSFHPVSGRDAFIAASPYQIDYMTLKTGTINITKFNLDRYLDDSSVRVGDVSITNPYFTSYRDKRPPFHAGIIKLLPTKLIQKIPIKLSLDTLKIQNGTIVYTELNDKTKETGIIPVTRVSGDIFPVKNLDLTERDSLRIRLNGYLMDTAWIRLRTRESFIDTLSGFLITVRMKPGPLLYLNPVLSPLASVKLQSGNLDTLSMRAVGKEYLSLGEMRMFYHDLKIEFLRNGSEDKKRFLTGLMTFIANSFVIKKENKKRVGVVYFPRLRDRSFINYYIKITLSGVASSVGARKNKKLLRRYKKQIKVRQLPPIDFD